MSLKAIWSGSTAYSRFLLAVGVILICAVFFTILSALASTVIYGISMTQLQTMLSDFSNPGVISILKFIQTVSTIGTFIIPAFIIAFLFDQQPMNYLSLSKKTNLTSVLLVIMALIAALPIINYLGDLNSRMSLPSFLSGIEKWMKNSENQAAELTKKFLDMRSPADMIFNVFMIALLPAIGEELLFRGIIQKIFTEWSKNIHVGVWTSAVLFSAMHMQFYGFFPRMLLGALFGYLLVWSGSLWLPMLAHFVNNASAVILTYLFSQQLIGVDADKIGTENDYVSVILSILLTGLLLWLFYRREKNKNGSVNQAYS